MITNQKLGTSHKNRFQCRNTDRNPKVQVTKINIRELDINKIKPDTLGQNIYQELGALSFEVYL